MNWSSFFVGIYVTLFIYHMLLFSGRTKDLSNLIFALFCLIYSFFIYWNSIYKISGSYNFSLFHNIYSVTCILFAVIIISLPHTLFDLRDRRNLSVLLAGVLGVVGTGLILLFNFLENEVFMRLFYATQSLDMMFYLGLLVRTLIVKRKIKSDNDALLFAGYAVLALFLVLHTIELVRTLDTPSPVVIRVFFIFMTLSFSVNLTRKINREHKELLVLKENLECKVRERTRQLEEAKKQKETFFINIAHEIKTPLTIVLNSFADFYKSYSQPGELEFIREGLDKLKKDIVNFLDLHKLESGKIYYNHEQVLNASEMVRRAIPLFAGLAAQRGIRLETIIKKDEILVKIDPYAFDRIINNLIENAIKYNRKDGIVRITIEEVGEGVLLKVSDTGVGIPEERMGNIFSPYYQISREKQNYQGMGMGLAIIKEICNALEARIEVKSREGEGSAFSITFPPVKKEESLPLYTGELPSTFPEAILSEEEALPAEGEIQTEKASILLVEDNAALLSFLIKKLEPDYNIFFARDGLEALEKINIVPPPDIIISDIMMDRMDGPAFRAKLLEEKKWSTVPFIFLTAQLSEEIKLKCLSQGAVDYIVKPFSLDELLYKISSQVKLRRALNEASLEKIRIAVNQHIQQHLDQSGTSSRGGLYTQYGISDQEIRVISFLKEGLMYKEIASTLNISLNSVRTYIRRIHKKLNIKATSELFTIFPGA